MSERVLKTLAANLVRFTRGGDYVGEPTKLQGFVVVDDDHGVVVEIPLPLLPDGPRVSTSILIRLEELLRLSTMVGAHIPANPRLQ
jgi:hypothetical protein